MMSKDVIDTDNFLDMSLSTQALYFHLLLKADDDGFVKNPKRIMRMIGANDDEMKALISKKYIFPFESGVCIIKHWRIHNYIQNDRYKETNCTDEKKQLGKNKNSEYYLKSEENEDMDTPCIQNVSTGKDRLGKDRLGEDSIEREPTPKEIAYDFLNNNESDYRKKFLEKFKEKGYNEETIKEEMKKFILYWTEPNATGKKQRWETQKTFEVGRRLVTWLNNTKNFGSVNKSNFGSI